MTEREIVDEYKNCALERDKYRMGMQSEGKNSLPRGLENCHGELDNVWIMKAYYCGIGVF